MSIGQRQTQVLCDKKWRKLLKRAWLFRLIPFVEFVFGSGSLALGNVSPDSDFDVLIGARQGRIFSARFFCLAIFCLFGLARTRLDHGGSSRDKFCFNHFITSEAYKLSPPHTQSWQELYLNLVPVYGNMETINYFWKINSEWMGAQKKWVDDLRYAREDSFWIKKFLEGLLYGVMGDVLEASLKYLQIKKIERSLRTASVGYKPRVVYNDNELEFHPDRRKFEEVE